MSNVRYGYVHDTLVAVFEDSATGDNFRYCGIVNADTVILYDVPNFQPSGVTMPFTHPDKGIALWKGSASSNNVFVQLGENPALFPYGYRGSHNPFGAFNLFLIHTPESEDWSDVSARYIPFVLYAHKSDLSEFEHFWKQCSRKMVDHLKEIAKSEEGEYYEHLNWRYSNFTLNKKSGVIILGKDSEPELDEMIRVREYMRVEGYNADLIKQLPEIPLMSNDEKVRLWAMSSRFCIMIDRVPSGHIKEYELLKQQRTIFALLRPKGSGSTYMIGDDEVDINYIKIFEFDSSPLEVLHDVSKWSEEVVKKRIEYLDKTYPWRKQ